MNLKLNAASLRDVDPAQFIEEIEQYKRSTKSGIYIVLDSVLDTYNIGSIFRLADAVGANEVIMCGGSVTPPNHRIKKASINTTEWVNWRYFEDATTAIKKLKSEVKNIQVVAVEQNDKSIPYDMFTYEKPLCLVVGHETDGVSKEVLDLCDGIVELPMFGVNISLNVMVSLGIVLYCVLSDTGSA